MSPINKMNEVVAVVKHPQYIFTILSFLIGFFIFKKCACIFSDDDCAIGDNIPMTFIDSINLK